MQLIVQTYHSVRTFGNDAADATMILPSMTLAGLPAPEKLPDRSTVVPVLQRLHVAPGDVEIAMLVLMSCRLTPCNCAVVSHRPSYPIWAPSAVQHPDSRREHWSSSCHSSSSTSSKGTALSVLPAWLSAERSSRMLPRAPAPKNVTGVGRCSMRERGLNAQHEAIGCDPAIHYNRIFTLRADEPLCIWQRCQQCHHCITLPRMPCRILHYGQPC